MGSTPISCSNALVVQWKYSMVLTCLSQFESVQVFNKIARKAHQVERLIVNQREVGSNPSLGAYCGRGARCSTGLISQISPVRFRSVATISGNSIMAHYAFLPSRICQFDSDLPLRSVLPVSAWSTKMGKVA